MVMFFEEATIICQEKLSFGRLEGGVGGGLGRLYDALSRTTLQKPAFRSMARASWPRTGEDGEDSRCGPMS